MWSFDIEGQIRVIASPYSSETAQLGELRLGLTCHVHVGAGGGGGEGGGDKKRKKIGGGGGGVGAAGILEN